MDPNSVPVFGTKKRKRGPPLPQKGLRPQRLLFFTKSAARDKAASVTVHGSVKLLNAHSLPSDLQHTSIEDQRKLYGANLVAFDYEDIRLLDTPIELSGSDIKYCGTTGTFAKTASLIDLAKSVGIIDWPAAIRIHTDQLWALSHKRVPALVLPENARARLGTM